MPRTAHTPSKDQQKGRAAAAATTPVGVAGTDAATLKSLASEVTASRTVVLDTSVLMADPEAHLAFPGSDIVIPLIVIDELDRNKTRSDDAGRNARTVLRHIEDLRVGNAGDIATPVELPGGATLRIEPNGLRLAELDAHHLDPTVADHRIIAAALGLSGDGRAAVSIVSNDAALRIKAAVLGLPAAEHTPGRVGIHAPNRTGQHVLTLSWEALEALKGRAPVAISDLPVADQDLLAPVLENEFVLATGTALLARRAADTLVPLDRGANAWGLRPRNKEQACALNLALDPNVPLVALRGHAGTGKSILAIAAGLAQVVESDRYDQLMILRPMVSVGRQDLGFLPGDIADKTTPWFAAVVDAMVALSDGTMTFKQASDRLSLLVEQGKVALEPITFLRGRSLGRVFAVLDEAQNVEPSTVKTVISRMGAGSKLVMTGDDGQVDTPYISAVTCGLNVAVDAFAGLDVFGQVFFTKGERSRLADLAAERL